MSDEGLPFLAILALSQRYWETHRQGKREYKKLTDWAKLAKVSPA